MADTEDFEAQALAAMQEGDWARAQAAFVQIVAAQPQLANAHYNLGCAFDAAHNSQEAMASYLRAISLEPKHANAHFNLALAYFHFGKNAEAVEHMCRAAQLDALHLDALATFANTLCTQEQFALALKCFCLLQRGGPEGAHQMSGSSWFNFGYAYYRERQIAAALTCFMQAQALGYQGSSLSDALALVKLQLGQWDDGWQLLEGRWEKAGLQNERLNVSAMSPVPRLWLGETELRDKTILVWQEQGMGDVMMFARYIPEILTRCGKLIVLVGGSLVGLLRDSFVHEKLEVVGFDSYGQINGAQWVASNFSFDYHCPMMSLPLACGTKKTADIPLSKEAYFRVNPVRQAKWKARLQEVQKAQAISGTGAMGLRNVGLVWAGASRPGFELPHMKARSLHFWEFAPLFDIENVRWISLQKGEAAKQALQLPEGSQGISDGTSRLPAHWLDWSEAIEDWQDTAALVEQLDLVVACDTAVAHLSAGLGVPTALLNRFNGCWRWMDGREDSPWYASIRIFNQTAPNDWSVALRQLRNVLLVWSHSQTIGAASGDELCNPLLD